MRTRSAGTVVSPMDPNVNLDNGACEDLMVLPLEKVHYQTIVGSLMYASIGSRPGIVFPYHKLCRNQASAISMHMTAFQRALQYLKGTIDLNMRFKYL